MEVTTYGPREGSLLHLVFIPVTRSAERCQATLSQRLGERPKNSLPKTRREGVDLRAPPQERVALCTDVHPDVSLTDWNHVDRRVRSGREAVVEGPVSGRHGPWRSRRRRGPPRLGDCGSEQAFERRIRLGEDFVVPVRWGHPGCAPNDEPKGEGEDSGAEHGRVRREVEGYGSHTLATGQKKAGRTRSPIRVRPACAGRLARGRTGIALLTPRSEPSGACVSS